MQLSNPEYLHPMAFLFYGNKTINSFVFIVFEGQKQKSWTYCILYCLDIPLYYSQFRGEYIIRSKIRYVTQNNTWVQTNCPQPKHWHWSSPFLSNGISIIIHKGSMIRVTYNRGCCVSHPPTYPVHVCARVGWWPGSGQCTTQDTRDTGTGYHVGYGWCPTCMVLVLGWIRPTVTSSVVCGTRWSEDTYTCAL